MGRITARKSLLAIAVATAFCVESTAVYAAALEEVIVTARKREENLQQVPAAINVFTAETLKDRSVDSLLDMQSSTPNITMSAASGLQSGALSVFIRGIGNDPGFEQGVGVYMDDVYLQRTNGLVLDVFDIERIEILKGPQGNLYGRNTIGGAIKYITKEPSETFDASVDTKLGNYDLRQVKASVSGPLLEGLLSGGIGLAYKTRDGTQTNEYDGKKFNEQDGKAVRGTLKLTPLDTLSVKLMGSYAGNDGRPAIPNRLAADTQALQNQYNTAIAVGALPANSPPVDISQGTAPDKVNTNYDFDIYKQINRTFAATIQWDPTDHVALKSVTANRQGVNVQPYDFGTSDQAFIQTTLHDESRDFSQEFQINVSGEGYDAVGGIFYSDGVDNRPGETLLTPLFPIAAVGVGTPTESHIVFDRYTHTTKDWSEIKSLAYYGNIDWDLADAWHATVGARLTKDRRAIERDAYFDGTGYALLPNAGDFVFSAPISSGKFGPTTSNYPLTKAHWSNFSPTFKLAYDWSESTLLYGSVASGYKAGNFDTTSTVLGVVDPEKVRTYSTGIKTTQLDSKLRMNIEAFFNDYTNKQLAYITTDSTGQLVNFVGNVGKAHSQGVDFEANWLTPIDGLQVDFSLGYLEAAMDKYSTVNPTTKAAIDAASYTSLGFAPRWTVGSRISYSMPIADAGDLIFAGDASYRAKAYSNSPVDRTDPLAMTQQTPEYTIYNANLLFKTADKHWRFGLEGKNLANRRVVVNTFKVQSFVDAGYNDPRTVAVSAGYQF